MLHRIGLITNEKDFLLRRRTHAIAKVFGRWGADAIVQDDVLGIERDRIPVVFPLLENIPQASQYYSLAQRIKDIAVFDTRPNNQTQAIWMRITQHYYQAKSILLANKILKVIPDHTQLEDLVKQLLSESSVKILQIEMAADLALYYLLEAGESKIKDWAKKEGIDYPFKDFQELFIHILKTNFDYYFYQNVAFNSSPTCFSKRSEKDHRRGWLKFLADYYDGESKEDKQKEQEYIQVLMNMEWEGYSLLALKSQKRVKPFGQLWRNYLKAEKVAINLFDFSFYWKNGIPYQTTQTSQKQPLEGIIGPNGSMRLDFVDKI